MKSSHPLSRLSFPACLLAVVAVGFAGCNLSPSRSYARDDHEIVSTTAAGELSGRPTLGLPIPIPGFPTRLIPFAVEERKGLFQDSDPYTRGGYGSQSDRQGAVDGISVRYWMASVRWHNGIFHDGKTGEEWTILERRGVIGWWGQFAVEAEKDKPVTRAMVFIATVEDTNKDGRLNDLDANVAILTDGDGRRPRAVSPAGAQVWSANYDPALRQVLFLIVTDTDNDGRFTTSDEPVPYAMALGDAAARPIISDAVRQRVESLLK